MNAARLLQHFERVAETPGAVSRLRLFILDLAVRGKLVEQNPADEPASKLLRRIQKERDGLVGVGKVSECNLSLPLSQAEIAFDIPATWQWVRVQQVANARLGKMLDKAKNRGIPRLYLRNLNVRWFDFDLSDLFEMKLEDSELEEFALGNGDVLICEGGEPGRSAVWDERATDIYFQKAIHRVRFLGSIVPTYFVRAIYQAAACGRLEQFFTGVTIKHLTGKGLARYTFPLPPVAEQHRIVAKVDELMAVCDELAAAQAKREKRRGRLVAATLHGLGNGDASTQPGARSTFEKSARFTFRHLPRLTTQPTHIHQLRQTILNLAVRGKLVPRVASEGTADSVIQEIDRVRNKLIVEGMLGRHSALGLLTVEEAPFAIPSEWRWMRFGDITFCRDGERVPVSREERQHRRGPYDYYGASGVIDKIDRFLFEKPLLLIGEDGANLVNRSTPIAFIARGKYWVNNHAHVLDGISEGFLRYVELWINAMDLKPYVTGTAQPKMNQAKMNFIPVAIPPLAEQHRIVAKVDELMTLCDALEAQLTTTANTGRQLLEAVLHEALTSAA